MKPSSLTDQFAKGKSDRDDQLAEVIAEALSANDKVIEIRPAKRSKGMGLKGLLLLGAAVIVFAYWVQSSQKPTDFIEGVKEKTADQIHHAAEAIEEGSEAASERIEAGSDRAGEMVQGAGDAVQEAGDAVQEAGEEAAEQTKEAGKEAAEQTEEAGEEAAERADEFVEEEDDETYSSASSSSEI